MKKPLIWEQIKEFANSLNDSELQQHAIGWDEDRGYKIVGFEKTEEDRYFDGHCYSPKSSFDDFETDCQDKTDILP